MTGSANNPGPRNQDWIASSIALLARFRDVVRYSRLLKGGDHEATRVHHASRWHGGDMATRRARAAARYAGDRLPQQYIASGLRGPLARVRPGAERRRIYRGPERGYRISLGGGP